MRNYRKKEQCSPYLHSNFRQVNLHSKFFARINIGIMRFFECPLKLMQLIGCEGCPVSTVFLFGSIRVLVCYVKV